MLASFWACKLERVWAMAQNLPWLKACQKETLSLSHNFREFQKKNFREFSPQSQKLGHIDIFLGKSHPWGSSLKENHEEPHHFASISHIWTMLCVTKKIGPKTANPAFSLKIMQNIFLSSSWKRSADQIFLVGKLPEHDKIGKRGADYQTGGKYACNGRSYVILRVIWTYLTTLVSNQYQNWELTK